MALRKSSHATGMAGEFYVMERLFRLGLEPALTLGNAKSIDIIVDTKKDCVRTVSVKAVQGGGKWPVGKQDLSRDANLVFVFLLYRRFDDLTTDPEVWIMPAAEVERRKKRWLVGSAIYYSHREFAAPDLEKFKDAWRYVDQPSIAPTASR